MTLPRISHARRGLYLLAAAATAALLTPTFASAQKIVGAPVAGVTELEGVTSDGSPYLVRKPSNWNGIVVLDLDGYERWDDAAYELLLRAGYGTAGADRRAGYARERLPTVPIDRAFTLNRYEDMRRPLEALELFKARFGKPKFAIAFGRSAGGASAMVTAERRPDVVDGAVAMCATVDVVGNAGYNLIFDFIYVLKALLAPNDNQLPTHALPTSGADPALGRWRAMLEAAAKTPEGRAKIALAYTMVQYPVYASTGDRLTKPDYGDPDAVVNAAAARGVRVARRLGLLTVHGHEDFPQDLPIPGTPVPNPVGNDGAVYADYWTNADPELKRAVEAHYARLGLDLRADLRAIDAYPRVKLDRDNMRRGVLARGLPAVPLFRMDNLGDVTAPWHATKLYDRLIAFNGLGDRYRTSYVDNSGHCLFHPRQEFVAVEVMRERLQTGKWPATNAAALNARARAADGDGVIFVDPKPGPHTGTWRLAAYTDLFQEATYSTTTALVGSYGASVTPAQRQQLLDHLATAQRAAEQRQANQANAALDQFVGVANGIANRVVRTRLLAAAHQLRSAR